MRILRLDLTAFGCFSGLSLDLSAGALDAEELRASGRYGLHVINGPNEAGKSTSLRALVSLLYGIEPQSRDNFVHAYEQMRIGGRLESDAGNTLDCIRRKGNKRTLRELDDNAEADPGFLPRMLGNIDRPTFEAQFGLNDQRLRAGGLQILDGKGDVGEILFAAGAGLERLAAVRKQLASDAEQLFKPRASNPRINQLLARLAEARKTRAAAQLTANHYEERAAQLAEQERQLAAVKTQAANLATEARDLQRRRDALPLIAQRQRLTRELAELPATPPLRAEFADELRRIEKELAAARQACRQHEAACASLTAELAELHFDERLVASGDTVRQLYRRLDKYESTLHDRGTQEAELSQLADQAGQLLDDLGLAQLGAEAALALRPSPGERVTLQALGNQRQALMERRGRARLRTAELAEQLDRAEAALAQRAEPPATALLQAAISEARGEGDVEQRVATEERAVEKLAEDLARRLRNLPGFSGSLSDLAVVKVPTTAAIARYQRGLGEAEAAMTRASEQAALRTEDLAQQQEAYAKLVADRPAPSRGDLDAARALREAGWQLVRGALAGEERADAARDYAAGYPQAHGDLPRAYELAVDQADHVADDLWHSADVVARQEAQRAACEQAAARQSQAEESLAAAEQALAEKQAAWEALWRGTGVLPGSPEEMLDWLEVRDELRGLEDELAERRAATERQHAKIAELHAELCTQLTAAGGVVASEQRLSRLVVWAQERLDQLTEARREREKLQGEVADLEKQLPAARREQEAADSDWAAWESEWAQAVGKLKLAGDVAGAAVSTVLGQLDALAAVSLSRKDKEKRIAQMAADLARFERDAAEITRDLAGDLTAFEPHLATAQLHDRLRAADTAHTQHQAATLKLKAARAGLVEAQALLAAAEAELAGLCREAGSAAAEELPAVYESWRLRTQSEKELAGVEQALWQLAAPRSLDEFLVAAGEWDADRIAVRLAEVQAESDVAAARQEELTQLVAVERQELAKFDRREDAARAAEEEQGLLAELRQESLRYARAQVAAGVLEMAIDNYRQRNQGPILEEASRIVGRLTGGSLERLSTDYDDRDKLVLVGVRPDGKLVRHDAMSDGTRDQLYLALRLASLKQYLASAPEKLPLIVDDILVHFDDERSAAALEVLAELSHQTQVIFFTHHQHLVDLAEEHVSAADLFIERLEPAARAAAAG